MEIIVGIHGINIINILGRWRVLHNLCQCTDTETTSVLSGKTSRTRAKLYVFIQVDKMIYSTILDAVPWLFPGSVIS